MNKKNQKELTPARVSMIRALNLLKEGHLLLAKKELKKARKEVDKFYAKKS